MALPLFAAFVLAACDGSQPSAKGAEPPPPQVTVAKPTKKLVTDFDEYVGRFVAVDAVEVRARVSGYLDAIHFKDGQMVKSGDLLFTIDRRPFEIALAQAKANLAQAQANLAYAQSDLARGSNLVRDTTISQQTYDQRIQAKAVAEASVAAQDAAVRQAMLDLRIHRIARAGFRAHWRPARVDRQSGHWRHERQYDAACDHRVHRPDPLEFTVDEASYLRYTHTLNVGEADRSRHHRAGHAQAPRRDDVFA